MTCYLRVALPSPLRRLFDYLPPEKGEGKSLLPGIRISVPFGRRVVVGILIEVVTETTVPVDKLKHALEIIDDKPVIPKTILDLCLWVSQYYVHSLGDTLSWALPHLLRQGKLPDNRHEFFWMVAPHVQLDDPKLNRASKQKKAVQILQQHPHGIAQNLLGKLQIQLDTLRRLQEKQLVFCEKRPFKPTNHQGSWLIEPELMLNEQQESVVRKVERHLGQFQTFLLNGVTGSGKTETYFHLIHHVLQKGEQVLVLIPEINLSPQTLSRFQKRFNAKVVLIHSNLTDKERLAAWQEAKDGRANIVIGTRSAIFTPMNRLGLIVVDEEHDSSYKQQDGLRYHARDLAVVRGRIEQVVVLLGSATPSLESLHNVDVKRYQPLSLTQRAGDAKPPKIKCLDVRTQQLDNGLSVQLKASIAQTLEKGQQVLVFINRRGFAPVMICHDCGWLAQCPYCDTRLTLHLRERQLRCHHCEYSQVIPVNCPKCQCVDLRPLGVGTERTEERLKVLFKEYPIWRIDRDTTGRKQAMQEMVNEICTGQAGILVGTQMLAKGHHFPNVTLVAVLNADDGFFSSDFRASEKTAQLIVQVAGRAGREDQKGSVLIQTHLPDHPLLLQLLDKGYIPFAKQTLLERQQAHLPPFSYLALLRAEAYKLPQLNEFLENAALIANEELQQNEVLEVLGPIPAPMEKKAGRYRGQILIQSNQRAELHQFLVKWISLLEKMPKTSQIRWSIDVDPVDLC